MDDNDVALAATAAGCSAALHKTYGRSNDLMVQVAIRRAIMKGIGGPRYGHTTLDWSDLTMFGVCVG